MIDTVKTLRHWSQMAKLTEKQETVLSAEIIEALANRFENLETELARLKAQAESPDRQKLRDLVDVVWSDAAETPTYLSTEWADRLINQVFSSAAEPRPAVLPEDDEDGNPCPVCISAPGLETPGGSRDRG